VSDAVQLAIFKWVLTGVSAACVALIRWVYTLDQRSRATDARLDKEADTMRFLINEAKLTFQLVLARTKGEPEK